MNKPTPKIYRTTNWSSYNSALINRGNIQFGLIPRRNGTLNQRQTIEIKLIPIQPSNAV
jgi:hypothetical protein